MPPARQRSRTTTISINMGFRTLVGAIRCNCPIVVRRPRGSTGDSCPGAVSDGGPPDYRPTGQRSARVFSSWRWGPVARGVSPTARPCCVIVIANRRTSRRGGGIPEGLEATLDRAPSATQRSGGSTTFRTSLGRVRPRGRATTCPGPPAAARRRRRHLGRVHEVARREHAAHRRAARADRSPPARALAGVDREVRRAARDSWSRDPCRP